MLHDDIVLLNRWAKVVNIFKLGDVVTFWLAQSDAASIMS